LILIRIALSQSGLLRSKVQKLNVAQLLLLYSLQKQDKLALWNFFYFVELRVITIPQSFTKKHKAAKDRV